MNICVQRVRVDYIAFSKYNSRYDPEPSIEDMRVTKGLQTLSEKVDIQLLDHFVIGKKNVYSFAKEMPEYVSDNQDYKQAIQAQAKKKYKQREFDLEL